jgi:hypothetical protein
MAIEKDTVAVIEKGQPGWLWSFGELPYIFFPCDLHHLGTTLWLFSSPCQTVHRIQRTGQNGDNGSATLPALDKSRDLASSLCFGLQHE